MEGAIHYKMMVGGVMKVYMYSFFFIFNPLLSDETRRLMQSWCLPNWINFHLSLPVVLKANVELLLQQVGKKKCSSNIPEWLSICSDSLSFSFPAIYQQFQFHEIGDMPICLHCIWVFYMNLVQMHPPETFRINSSLG